jgi:hypothetical protein
MGVRYGRSYAAIITELAQALGPIEAICAFVGMEPGEWEALDPVGQAACVRTIADDLFYALGTEKEIPIGSARVFYDELHHRIRVRYADAKETDIYLIDRE